MADIFDGADDTMKALFDIEKNAKGEFGQALFKAVQAKEMKDIIAATPVEFGTLRASEKLKGPKGEGSRIFIIVEAGGPAASYAWFVHEDTEANHPRGGQAKYIIEPIRRNTSTLPARIVSHIRFRKIFN